MRIRATLAAAAALAVAAALVLPSAAQAPSTMRLPSAMQPGQRVQLGPMMGQRVVREIMIGQDGNTVVLMYDMGADQPQSRRVLRLENVNGMLEVVYDTTVPTMSLGRGGEARLVPSGGGMYSVEYGPAR
jgi:Spy/CpxP family protein refolding chaperone